MSDFVSKVILVCKDGPTIYGQTGLFGWYNFTDLGACYRGGVAAIGLFGFIMYSLLGCV